MPRIAYGSVIEIEYVRADEIHRAGGEYKGMDDNFVEIRDDTSGRRVFFPRGNVVRISVLAKPGARDETRPDWLYGEYQP